MRPEENAKRIKETESRFEKQETEKVDENEDGEQIKRKLRDEDDLLGTLTVDIE